MRVKAYKKFKKNPSDDRKTRFLRELHEELSRSRYATMTMDEIASYYDFEVIHEFLLVLDPRKLFHQKVLERVAQFIEHICRDTGSGNLELRICQLGIPGGFVRVLFESMHSIPNWEHQGDDLEDGPFIGVLESTTEALLWLVENSRTRHRIRKDENWKKCKCVLEFYMFNWPTMAVASNALGIVSHTIKPREIDEEFVRKLDERLDVLVEANQKLNSDKQKILKSRIAYMLSVIEQSPAVDYAKQELGMESMFQSLQISKKRNPDFYDPKDKNCRKNLQCGWCKQVEGDVQMLQCSRCRSIYYCSKACQKKHWKIHKKTCTKPK